jgi:hypothetical protein
VNALGDLLVEFGEAESGIARFRPRVVSGMGAGVAALWGTCRVQTNFLALRYEPVPEPAGDSAEISDEALSEDRRPLRLSVLPDGSGVPSRRLWPLVGWRDRDKRQVEGNKDE